MNCEHHRIDADGSIRVPTDLGELHVVVRGSGPVMLFWPSLLMDHHLWSSQAEHFSRFMTTVVVDLPGHGRSSPLRRTFTLVECADAMVQVLDTLGVDRAHVVGNSWGAMAGATFAARYGDRLQSAILMNGTGSAAPVKQRAQFAALRALARLLRGIRGPLTRPVVRAFLGPTTIGTKPGVVRDVINTARANDVVSALNAVRSVVSLRADQHRALAAVRARVLVIAGAEDATFPVPEVRRLAAAIPGARFEVVERAGHLLALEVPGLVNELIDEFIAGSADHADHVPADPSQE